MPMHFYLSIKNEFMAIPGKWMEPETIVSSKPEAERQMSCFLSYMHHRF